MIIERLLNDESFDWTGKLHDIILHAPQNIKMYLVDANQELDKVLSDTYGFMEQ